MSKISKKDFDKTINHIKRKDIPKTNNLLEGFFKITFLKKYKRRFRTEKGVKNYLRHMTIRWYERNVLHEKSQPKTTTHNILDSA